jgi:signal transduction histidine kinase
VLSGREWRGEWRNRKKNGKIFWESAAVSPIVDQTGNILHLLAVSEDITERRQIESELRQAQKLEGIGQLAAGIAHEINTPTQFVTDNLTFLRDSWDTTSKLVELYRGAIRKHQQGMSLGTIAEIAEAEQTGDLEFIAEEVPRAIAQGLDGARRVADIVRAMKEFSHPDSAEKTAADLNKGIASTITVARNEWKYVAEVVTNFDETLPPVICYPGEVNQVILNLLVNAAQSIKEKEREGKKGKITVCTRMGGEFAEIAITDTGVGIAEEIQSRVYEPFFTTKEVGKGSGQGLTFAHSVIVKKHHGKLWFETELGRGTTFVIQLPIETKDIEKETDDEASSVCG